MLFRRRGLGFGGGVLLVLFFVGFWQERCSVWSLGNLFRAKDDATGRGAASMRWRLGTFWNAFRRRRQECSCYLGMPPTSSQILVPWVSFRRMLPKTKVIPATIMG